MAQLYSIDSAAKLYDISAAVGEGCPNKTEDVMLVQWLLKRHFDRNDKKALLGNAWAVTVVNGMFSSELAEIIKIYQYDTIRNNRAAKFRMDGKIQPIKNVGKEIGSSPMVTLNFSVKSYFQKQYLNPSSDPYLMTEFKRVFERVGKAA